MTPYQPGPRRGLAVAAFVIGLSSLLLAWVPFVFVLAGAGAIVAMVFAVVALRRVAAGTGTGKSFAVWGAVLSVGAAGLCVPGFFFTREVWRTMQDLANGGDHRIVLTDCRVAGGMAYADGTITNLESDSRSYSIVIAFTDGTRVVDRDTVSVRELGPDKTGTFKASAYTGADQVECLVDSVSGILP